MEIVSIIAVLGGLVLIIGWLLLSAQARLRDNGSELIDAIDALLPQTQCAQCGYPGCRPYAEAVANGAAIDLCPPGGEATCKALQRLLGRDGGTAPLNSEPQLARIRERECIGCFFCIRACPVDAIIGAPGFMHTVIEAECTGCELCVPACPVDCIDLINYDAKTTNPIQQDSGVDENQAPAPATPCIGCNRCEPVCPVELAPQELLWLSNAKKWRSVQALGLERCVECRLCDRACPSHIPLAATFARSKQTLAQATAKRARAAYAKSRHEARTARLAAARKTSQARRAARLARRVHPAKPAEAQC